MKKQDNSSPANLFESDIHSFEEKTATELLNSIANQYNLPTSAMHQLKEQERIQDSIYQVITLFDQLKSIYVD